MTSSRLLAPALLLPFLVTALAGCSSSPRGNEPDAGLPDGAMADSGLADDGSVVPPDGSVSDADPPDGSSGTDCVLLARECDGEGAERECTDSGGAPAWSTRACPGGQSCRVDRCVPSCVDECLLGNVEGGRTCRLYSEPSGGFVEPPAGMHTLARRHQAYLRKNHLTNGFIASALFRTPSLTEIERYTGAVDSAEWTGTYLAAESLRLMTTGSPDADANVQATIERLEELFEVTGMPGYMARIWGPVGRDALTDGVGAEVFDGVVSTPTTFRGAPAFYHGFTSRDMYSGVMFGLSMAYDATSSEEHRERIRSVVVTLARELIMDRTDVPVRLRFHSFGSWQVIDQRWNMAHTVLVPDEMVDGHVLIQVGSDESPSDYNSSTLTGAREFLPDMRTVLSQAPVIGGLIPSVPRPGSAIMLSNILRFAMHVTEGVAGREADHDAIEAHYLGRRDEWLPIIQMQQYHNASECYRAYFGQTIVYHSMYNLIRLEPDGPFRTSLQRDVLGARMYEEARGQLNVYFDYASAAMGPPGLLSAAELATATSGLAEFVPPPKLSRPVDNRGAYATSGDCPELSTTPISVGERVPTDFIFQHHPFQLVNPLPHNRHVYAPVDYLIAYWMGRHHGFIEEDSPESCTRWD